MIDLYFYLPKNPKLIFASYHIASQAPRIMLNQLWRFKKAIFFTFIALLLVNIAFIAFKYKHVLGGPSEGPERDYLNLLFLYIIVVHSLMIISWSIIALFAFVSFILIVWASGFIMLLIFPVSEDFYRYFMEEFRGFSKKLNKYGLYFLGGFLFFLVILVLVGRNRMTKRLLNPLESPELLNWCIGIIILGGLAACYFALKKSNNESINKLFLSHDAAHYRVMEFFGAAVGSICILKHMLPFLTMNFYFDTIRFVDKVFSGMFESRAKLMEGQASFIGNAESVRFEEFSFSIRVFPQTIPRIEELLGFIASYVPPIILIICVFQLALFIVGTIALRSDIPQTLGILRKVLTNVLGVIFILVLLRMLDDGDFDLWHELSSPSFYYENWLVFILAFYRLGDDSNKYNANGKLDVS